MFFFNLWTILLLLFCMSHVFPPTGRQPCFSDAESCFAVIIGSWAAPQCSSQKVSNFGLIWISARNLCRAYKVTYASGERHCQHFCCAAALCVYHHVVVSRCFICSVSRWKQIKCWDFFPSWVSTLSSGLVVFSPDENIFASQVFFSFLYAPSHESRSFLSLVSPYSHEVIIIHYYWDDGCYSLTDKSQNCGKNIAGNAQEELMVLNRSITVAARCGDPTCSYNSREVYIGLCWRLQGRVSEGIAVTM